MEKIHNILENIKANFEIIQSNKAWEDYSNGSKMSNKCLAFYTYSKKYENLCYLSELVYIASELI